jgi:hypothetical protein
LQKNILSWGWITDTKSQSVICTCTWMSPSRELHVGRQRLQCLHAHISSSCGCVSYRQTCEAYLQQIYNQVPGSPSSVHYPAKSCLLIDELCSWYSISSGKSELRTQKFPRYWRQYKMTGWDPKMLGIRVFWIEDFFRFWNICIYVVRYLLFLFIYFWGDGTWAWTQGFTLAMQFLYHLSHTPNLLSCSVFFK